MTDTRLHDALRGVSSAVDVPPVDTVAFDRRVHGVRRRRTATRLVAGTAAAVVVVAGVLSLGRLDSGRDDRSGVDVATGASAYGLSETVFFLLNNGNLASVDPRGEAHDLHQRVTGLIGWTSERVYAYGPDDEIVTLRIVRDGSSESYVAEPSPVTGEVAEARLSGDGRYLAWQGISDRTVHRLDLETGQQDLDVPAEERLTLMDVSAEGVLVMVGDAMSVRTPDGRSIAVPDGFPNSNYLANGRVLANQRPDVGSVLYDVSGGVATRLAEIDDGFGRLSPDGQRVAFVRDTPSGRRVTIWEGGVERALTGLPDGIDTYTWATEDTVIASTRQALYACDADLQCTRLPVEGEIIIAN